MRSSSRRSGWRVVISVMLAVVAVARGGGVALACESFVPVTEAAAIHASHPGAAKEAPPEHEDCDAPERVSECLLMPACAPALSPAVTTAGDVAMTAVAIAVPTPRAPAPVDRSPEPPPPRA